LRKLSDGSDLSTSFYLRPNLGPLVVVANGVNAPPHSPKVNYRIPGLGGEGVAMTILTFVSVLSVGVSIGYVIAGVFNSAE